MEDLDLRLREMRGKVQVPYRQKIHVVSDEAEVTSSLEMLGMLDRGRSSLAVVLVLTFCRTRLSRLIGMREHDLESGLVGEHQKGRASSKLSPVLPSLRAVSAKTSSSDVGQIWGIAEHPRGHPVRVVEFLQSNRAPKPPLSADVNKAGVTCTPLILPAYPNGSINTR